MGGGGEYILVESDGNTELTVVYEPLFRGVWRLTGPAVRSSIRRNLPGQLRMLAANISAGLTGPDAAEQPRS
jgi:hypothetical protein